MPYLAACSLVEGPASRSLEAEISPCCAPAIPRPTTAIAALPAPSPFCPWGNPRFRDFLQGNTSGIRRPAADFPAEASPSSGATERPLFRMRIRPLNKSFRPVHRCMRGSLHPRDDIRPRGDASTRSWPPQLAIVRAPREFHGITSLPWPV